MGGYGWLVAVGDPGKLSLCDSSCVCHWVLMWLL